jgi:hypothetical protein
VYYRQAATAHDGSFLHPRCIVILLTTQYTHGTGQTGIPPQRHFVVLQLWSPYVCGASELRVVIHTKRKTIEIFRSDNRCERNINLKKKSGDHYNNELFGISVLSGRVQRPKYFARQRVSFNQFIVLWLASTYTIVIPADHHELPT